jgi:hypothetical protein
VGREALFPAVRKVTLEVVGVEVSAERCAEVASRGDDQGGG